MIWTQLLLRRQCMYLSMLCLDFLIVLLLKNKVTLYYQNTFMKCKPQAMRVTETLKSTEKNYRILS